MEPKQGVFNWTLCDRAIKGVSAQGKYLMINPQTGKAAPTDWLPQAGVPTVQVCSHNWMGNISNCPKEQWMNPPFPFYFAPNYYPLWRNYQQQLHDHIKALPKELARTVISIQVALGDTGDVTVLVRSVGVT